MENPGAIKLSPASAKRSAALAGGFDFWCLQVHKGDEVTSGVLADAICLSHLHSPRSPHDLQSVLVVVLYRFTLFCFLFQLHNFLRRIASSCHALLGVLTCLFLFLSLPVFDGSWVGKNCCFQFVFSLWRLPCLGCVIAFGFDCFLLLC